MAGSGGVPEPAWTTTIALLLALVAIAAFLRLFQFGSSPPGLNQDEAVNAWNAWCLLRTGTDMTGDRWPIFYSHAIGDNRTTLYFYALLPFQALGGLSEWTTRLPNAIAGVLCVPLAFFAGDRLFGRSAALGAALAMAVGGWAVFLSRWGIEGGLCPLLALLPLVLVLAAGFPLSDRIESLPRPWLGALAGVAAGVACYGYWPMRIWIPAFALGILLLTFRRLASTSRGRWTAITFLLGLAVTFGPIAVRHATDPGVAQRWEMTRLWQPGASPLQIAGLVLERYAAHFSPDFLFVRGDRFEIFRLPGEGAFPRWLAPFIAAGLVVALMRVRRSRSARTQLLLLAIYPAGDLVSHYDGAHFLRSAPGIGAWILLAGLGLSAFAGWLRKIPRRAALVVAMAAVAVVVTTEVRFYGRFFGSWNREPLIYHGYHADLMEACRWIRARPGRYDVVIWTTRAAPAPFAPTLVGLRWDPERWFREPRDRRKLGEWDVYVRYGPNSFLYGDWLRPALDSLQANDRIERALFVIRPGQLGLSSPVHVIRGPLGEALWLVEAEL